MVRDAFCGTLIRFQDSWTQLIVFQKVACQATEEQGARLPSVERVDKLAWIRYDSSDEPGHAFIWRAGTHG